ncbi:MAG: GatB/YqeY domain-containing protein [Chthoniobacterales bacterium]
MTISEILMNDLKEAMKAKDTLRVNTLRMLKSAFTYAATAEGGASGALDDAACIQVIRKQIKQRRDSIESFKQAGRLELAENEQLEIAVLEKFLPIPLSEAEVTEIVRAAIAETGATSRKDMGAVMKIVNAKAAGRADGKTLSGEVQKQLA